MQYLQESGSILFKSFQLKKKNSRQKNKNTNCDGHANSLNCFSFRCSHQIFMLNYIFRETVELQTVFIP